MRDCCSGSRLQLRLNCALLDMLKSFPKSVMRRARQNKNVVQMSNKAFQPERNLVPPVCVQTSFTDLNITQRDKTKHTTKYV